jgi:hypothetical protein
LQESAQQLLSQDLMLQKTELLSLEPQFISLQIVPPQQIQQVAQKKVGLKILQQKEIMELQEEMSQLSLKILL